MERQAPRSATQRTCLRLRPFLFCAQYLFFVWEATGASLVFVSLEHAAPLDVGRLVLGLTLALCSLLDLVCIAETLPYAFGAHVGERSLARAVAIWFATMILQVCVFCTATAVALDPTWLNAALCIGVTCWFVWSEFARLCIVCCED